MDSTHTNSENTMINEYGQDETRIRSRTLKPSQRRAIQRVLRFYIDNNSRYNTNDNPRDWTRTRDGVTSIRITITRPYPNQVSWSVQTHRSDCGRHSPRAVCTEQYAAGFVGPRGGLKVYIAQHGLTESLTHVRKMLHAK